MKRESTGGVKGGLGHGEEGKYISLQFLYERGAMGMTYLVLTVYVDLIFHVFLCSIG